MRKEYLKKHVAYFSVRMESYFFRVLPSAFSLTRSNLRRALKSAQEQEDRATTVKQKRQSPTCCRDRTRERKVEKAVGDGSCQARCSNC